MGVGTCTIQASAPGDANHIDAVPVEASFEVNPREIVVQASGGPMTAGDDPPVITPIIDPGSFVLGDTAATALSGSPDCSTTATSASTPGNYPSTCTQGTLGSTDYSFVFVDGSVTVIQTSASITLDASQLTPLYDGTAKTVTATTSPSGLPYTVSYADADDNSIGPPTAPGIYTVTARITDPNQIALPVTGKLFIQKAPLTVTCNDQLVQSGDPVPALTYSITGFVGTDDSSVIKGGTPSCDTPATQSSPVGSYLITAHVSALSADDYNLVTGPPGTYNIAPVVTSSMADGSSPTVASAGGTDGYTATGQGGTAGDQLTVAEYADDPSGVDTAPAPVDAGSFFDVKLSPGNTFSSVVLVACNVDTTNPHLYWYNQAADDWEALTLDSNPSPAPPAGCVQATITSGTSPSLAQLTGTVFGTNTPNGATRALVRTLSVAHRANGVIVRWRVASNHGIAGFRLTAGIRVLTRQFIVTHRSRQYSYTVPYRGTQPITLHVLLTNGREWVSTVT